MNKDMILQWGRRSLGREYSIQSPGNTKYIVKMSTHAWSNMIKVDFLACSKSALRNMSALQKLSDRMQEYLPRSQRK